MQTRITTVFAAFAMMAAVTAAQAQVSAGKHELAFSGSYSSLDAGGFDIDMLAITGTYGYFVSDPLQLSVNVAWLDLDVAGSDLTARSIGVGADFHFATTTALVPYVGAGLNWVDADFGFGSDDDWSWQVRGGLKQFVANNVALKYEVSYTSYDELDLDGFTVSVGLSFFF